MSLGAARELARTMWLGHLTLLAGHTASESRRQRFKFGQISDVLLLPDQRSERRFVESESVDAKQELDYDSRSLTNCERWFELARTPLLPARN